MRTGGCNLSICWKSQYDDELRLLVSQWFFFFVVLLAWTWCFDQMFNSRKTSCWRQTSEGFERNSVHASVWFRSIEQAAIADRQRSAAGAVLEGRESCSCSTCAAAKEAKCTGVSCKAVFTRIAGELLAALCGWRVKIHCCYCLLHVYYLLLLCMSTTMTTTLQFFNCGVLCCMRDLRYLHEFGIQLSRPAAHEWATPQCKLCCFANVPVSIFAFSR